MTAGGSITYGLHRLGDGDAAAAQPLGERFFDRLTRLACLRLRGTPRRAAVEEDAAQSAFDSLCCSVLQSRFTQLRVRHNSWGLLVRITEPKATNPARHERREKHDVGRVISGMTPPGSGSSSVPDDSHDQIIGLEAAPEFAALVAEHFRRLQDRLPNDDLRRVAVWRKEGYTNAEIADELGYTVITAEGRLNRIRKHWEQESLQ